MWHIQYGGQRYFNPFSYPLPSTTNNSAAQNTHLQALAFDARKNQRQLRKEEVNNLSSNSSGSGGSAGSGSDTANENSFIFTGYYGAREQPKIDRFQQPEDKKSCPPQITLNHNKE